MSNFGFESISYTSIAQKIVDQICRAIIDGRYKPGDKIPTESELAVALNVGRNSVREAVKILVAYGILEIRRAEGTFVCTGASRSIINPMIYGLILSSGNSHEEMMEYQTTVDKSMTRLCICHYNDEDFKHIEAAYNQLMDALSCDPYDIEEVLAKDRAFHDAIADASHNEFMKITHHSIWDLMQSIIREEVTVSMKENRQRMLELHFDTFEAIKNRDENAVETAIHKTYYIQNKQN